MGQALSLEPVWHVRVSGVGTMVTAFLLGPRGLVQAAADGEALYSDHQHLSLAGAARVAGAVFPQFIKSQPE